MYSQGLRDLPKEKPSESLAIIGQRSSSKSTRKLSMSFLRQNSQYNVRSERSGSLKWYFLSKREGRLEIAGSRLERWFVDPVAGGYLSAL